MMVFWPTWKRSNDGLGLPGDARMMVLAYLETLK
jgi:hypothetical protein